MMNYDIFLSFRPHDAGAHAWMVYRDLSNAGYSVYFHDEFGNSGLDEEPSGKLIPACKDVVLLLSHCTFSESDKNDALYQDLLLAISHKKHILGIILPGFEGFPKDLPTGLEDLASIPCLSVKNNCYDAMALRLISGQFLVSESSRSLRQSAEWSVDFSAAEDRLDSLIAEASDPSALMALRSISRYFSASEACRRLSDFMNRFFQGEGLRELSAYDGNFAADYGAFIGFFEEISRMIRSGDLAISLVDRIYRVPFFAVCNNPILQREGLEILTEQHPAILGLYDDWSAYICANHPEAATVTEEIPQFSRDLHTCSRLHMLAKHSDSIQKIQLLNRKMGHLEVDFRKLLLSDLDEIVEFQDEVMASIPRLQETNVYAALSREEYAYDLEHDLLFGAYHDGKMVGLLVLLPSPTDDQNMLGSLPEYQNTDRSDIMVVDVIIVSSACRGFGLQRTFYRLAEFIGYERNVRYECSTVSPYNYHSLRNSIQAGFRVIGHFKKYASSRNFFIKDMKNPD